MAMFLIDADPAWYEDDDWHLDYVAEMAAWEEAAMAFDLATSGDLAMAEARDAAGIPDSITELMAPRVELVRAA